jgi:putative phosphoesterase
MRLALVSDIHANFEALRALKDALSHADLIICLGDLVGYYCQVNEVIEYFRDTRALCVMGSHDSFLLSGCPSHAPLAVRFGIEFAERAITDDNRQWLAGLPLAWGGFLGGRSFFLVHGSPWRPLDDYLYEGNSLLTQLDVFDYDVIAFGQTHRALQRLERRPCLLNPGSVGQPRDAKANASALILNT